MNDNYFVVTDELPLDQVKARYARWVYQRRAKNKTHTAAALGINHGTLNKYLRFPETAPRMRTRRGSGGRHV